MDEFLRAETAVVTGAGNGIGQAVSIRLAAAGARVVLIGRRQDTLRRTRDLIDSGSARIETCDVADGKQVSQLADRLSDETVSILINNAGIAGPTRPLTDISPEEWDEVFAVNVRGTYLMCRAFLPHMTARQSGHVINIASVSGKRPLENRTPYVASKYAVIALTATLAFEVGPSGVSVNSLSPGPVRGERMRRNFEQTAALLGGTPEEAEADFVARAALKRMVEEDEVARAVLAMLAMPGLCAADIDLSAGMVAR